MVKHKLPCWSCALVLGQILLCTSLSAAIVQTGDVVPDVNSWSSFTLGYIGFTSDGSVLVDEGSSLASGAIVALGTHSDTTGAATVTGTGSKLTNSGNLYVGHFGNGILTVSDGGEVTNANFGYLGNASGSLGTVTVTGVGSKWTSSRGLIVGNSGNGTLTVSDGGEVVAGRLYASLSDLFGDGTITATLGGVLDAELLFDAIQGNQTTVPFGSGGTLTVQASGGILGAGYKQSGSLTVRDGIDVSSSTGYLGYRSGSTGTAIVIGEGSSWTNSGNLAVGERGNGTLTIEAGGQVNSKVGVVSRFAGSTGAATVTGAGSQWTNSGELNVGRDGPGSLTIEAGGQVSNTHGYLGLISGSTGTATVTGAGSSWTNSSELNVGHDGHGYLTVEAGGQVSNSTGYLGRNSGSTGTAKVTGEGSSWTNSSDFYIGRDGDGYLTIEAGGQVTNNNVFLGFGFSSRGSATITGAGSTWANSGDLYIGRHSGRGSLTIEAGGQVSNATGYVGYGFGSGGTVTVTGTGSMWTSINALVVGRLGTSSLTIKAGGQVSNATGYVGYDSLATGAATVTGASSSWTNGGFLDVGRYGSGSLTIEAEGQVINTEGYLGRFSGSTGTATVTGPGSKWTNSGALYVGHGGDGSLTITNGGLVTVGGTLSIAVNENSAGVINMATGGMLALWGEADQSLAAFLDMISGTGEIRFWEPSLDDWAPLTTATYGEDYTLEYLTTGELTGYTLLTVGTLGDFDFNGDGIVDGHDFLAWQRNSHLGNLADWETAFGNTTSQVSSSAVVPEPSASWLVVAGGMLLFPSRLWKK